MLFLFVLLLPAIPGIALQVAGFERRGATDQVFQSGDSLPSISNAVIVSAPATLDLGPYGTAAVNQYELITGNDTQGTPLAQLTLDEADLMVLCHGRTDVCGTRNNQIRNARIDLRPGGTIIFADVFVPQLNTWQNLGAVIQLEDTQASVVGVDMDGVLYSPSESAVETLMDDFETVANDILTQIALNTASSRYTLDRVFINDQQLTLILR